MLRCYLSFPRQHQPAIPSWRVFCFWSALDKINAFFRVPLRVFSPGNSPTKAQQRFGFIQKLQPVVQSLNMYSLPGLN